MIPKILHCCWFGMSPIPKTVKRYMKNWANKMPDFQIKIWTELEFDMNAAPAYVQEAYRCKKYAFVSDYVRLYALYNEGGVYLDTDVEVLKPFDLYLNQDAFIGFESENRLSTAVIAAKPNSEWIKCLMKQYEKRSFIVEGQMDLTTNVEYITNFFLQNGLQIGNQKQAILGVTVYPSEYFSPKSWDTGKCTITDNTVVIHHFSGTWHSPIVRLLSLFFSNETIVKVASLKEKVLKLVKNGLS